jgi:hypothetical protein
LLPTLKDANLVVDLVSLVGGEKTSAVLRYSYRFAQVEIDLVKGVAINIITQMIVLSG